MSSREQRTTVKGSKGDDKLDQGGLINDLNTTGLLCPKLRNLLNSRVIRVNSIQTGALTRKG